MRLLILVLLGCSVPPSESPGSRCDPAGIFVGGDLETVYGRLHKALARAYPSTTGDPLTRTFQTTWEPVPGETRSVNGEQCIVRETVLTHDIEHTVTIEGQFPFRIRTASRARVHERFANTGELHRTFITTAQVKDERALATLIRDDVRDLAVRCDNTTTGTCDSLPRGTPADLVLPAHRDGIVVSPARSCPHDAAYLRVERLTGTRQLGVDRTHGTTGAIGAGCDELPRDQTNCPTVSVVAVAHEAARRIRRDGIVSGGTGVGACGQATGTYDALNFSVIVLDWNAAGRAVALLSEVLAEYDLRGYVGVTVAGQSCSFAL
ncbi:MAG TPA: hypothetical protein VIU61_06830 [Kofleriaceae bacterium]